jgi:hypothetical protein
MIYMKVLLVVQYWFSILLYIANVCICMINLQKLQSLNTTLVGIVHENCNIRCLLFQFLWTIYVMDGQSMPHYIAISVKYSYRWHVTWLQLLQVIHAYARINKVETDTTSILYPKETGKMLEQYVVFLGDARSQRNQLACSYSKQMCRTPNCMCVSWLLYFIIN